MAEQSNTLDRPKLVVTAGLHEGASVDINLGEVRVGSDPSADIVVTDLPVPFAFELDWDGRKLVLKNLGAPASLSGLPVAPGRRCRVKRSSSLVIGGLPFRVDVPAGAPTAASSSRRARSGFAAGVVATLALGGLASLVAAVSTPPSTLLAAAISGPAMPAPAAAVHPVSHVAPVRDDRGLLDDMRRQLASQALDGITVDLQPDGAIAASGRVPPVQGEAWHAAKRWFDAAAAGRAVLVDNVDTSSAASALQIQAVYTGRTPYVIDGDGQKLFLGSTLADGSVLQRIEGRHVLLKRGDQLVAVRF